VHHDLWDVDIAIPHILFDTQINKKPGKGLAAMRADGYLFLIDRETGKAPSPDRRAQGVAGPGDAHVADATVSRQRRFARAAVRLLHSRTNKIVWKREMSASLGSNGSLTRRARFAMCLRNTRGHSLNSP
jgi:glucose dehydrogenase